jgi:CRISPR/Cas system-associated exonuclease Cas4 (RecB family)
LYDLIVFDQAHPLARKRLVAPDIAWGWETLVALARRQRGIIGWEATTLLALADAMAFTAMDEHGLRRASDVELTMLVDRAIADCRATSAVGDGFGSLAAGLGFRRAVKDAILTLRTAGVSAEQVQGAVEQHAPAWDAAAVLSVYERLLADSALLDPAGLFRLAIERFDDEARYVLDGHTLIAAELAPRGLARTLLDLLISAGATILPEPVPRGDMGPVRSSAPELDLFVAASPSAEVLEVLRRVVREGRRWDEVEIVTTDRDTYGVALDALCQHEGIACTLLDGVPLMRTRVGRAAERWLRWMEDGLPADLVREAIEAGDLAMGPTVTDSAVLSAAFARLKIGWGRARYEDAVQRIRDGHFLREVRPRDGETEAEHAARIEARRRDGESVLPLLLHLLAATPPVPELGTHRDVPSSCVRLARALGALLGLLPLLTDADHRTSDRLRQRLGELEDGDDGDVPFGLAMAELRDGISDLRAWTDASPVEHPRNSQGGAVHLTDISHGGTTGRPRVFVVGLDADRVAGSRVQDPILPDGARRSIGAHLLPLLGDRRDERRWQLAAMLARAGGRVTVSLATAADGADDTVSPAREVLDLFRLEQGDASLGYKNLHEHLGEPCCAVPRDEAALDARGAWLSAIAGGERDYRDGESLVRSAWPGLDAGLAAAAHRAGDVFTAWHGHVPAAAGQFDPRLSTSPISPTSLELLSSCPLAWFYHYGLGIRPPDTQEYDGEIWLTPLDRGSLLHRVYEQLATKYRGRQQALLDEAALNDVMTITNALLQQYRDDIAPPSVAVYQSEAGEILASARAFLEAERENARQEKTTWEAFELPFPRRANVRFPVGGSAIPVRGFIDRVDRTRDGQLVVIDYKTGKADRFQKDKRTGPFAGGRQLQPAIYAVAAEQELGGDVARFEYRFPTQRGENHDVRYDGTELAAATGIVAGLMHYVERGTFPPTTEAHDCTYCDYAPVCRVSLDDRKTHSPRAAWAEAHAESLMEYQGMLARRSPA